MVAIGQGRAASPSRWGPWGACIAMMVKPMTVTETRTPMSRPTCWWNEVPTRQPVFRSWEVAPALAAAMQTMAPRLGRAQAAACWRGRWPSPRVRR